MATRSLSSASMVAPAVPSLHVKRDVGPDGAVFELSGILDEHADLSFFRDLHGTIRVHLDDLHRINSFGVRIWMAAIADIPEDATVELYECPPQFVDQINLLKGFLGRAKVVSFQATYACDRCLAERDVLVDAETCHRDGDQLPTDVICACGQTMQPDLLEDVFLGFLRERG